MSINTVALSGRLTRDPELRKVGEDMQVAQFGLAVDEYSKGEKRANFFDVVVWGKTAENVVKFVSKGSMVALSGKLRYREWEGDSGKRSKVEVVAQSVQFLDPPKQDAERKPKSEAEDFPF